VGASINRQPDRRISLKIMILWSLLCIISAILLGGIITVLTSYMVKKITKKGTPERAERVVIFPWRRAWRRAGNRQGPIDVQQGIASRLRKRG